MEIINLVTELLGEPKQTYGDWTSFNCPSCAELNGGVDNRYNLEVNTNLEEGLFCHCWKCGYAGKLSNLFKRFGGWQYYNSYKEVLNDIRTHQLYIFGSQDKINAIIKETADLVLPNGFTPFISSSGNIIKNEGYLYLLNRGLNNNIIQRNNIGFIDNRGEFKYQKRIIVPSYDEYGNLNYWLGRDWTNKNKVRYLNANVSKHTIVFNESNINYYEPIILCEGVFDSIVLPNSIPLLGKTLNIDHAVYNLLLTKAKSDIYICLDSDAVEDAYKMYKMLDSNYSLNGRIKYIEPKQKDASLIYKEEGIHGIINLMRGARRVNEFDLLINSF